MIPDWTSKETVRFAYVKKRLGRRNIDIDPIRGLSSYRTVYEGYRSIGTKLVKLDNDSDPGQGNGTAKNSVSEIRLVENSRCSSISPFPRGGHAVQPAHVVDKSSLVCIGPKTGRVVVPLSIGTARSTSPVPVPLDSVDKTARRARTWHNTVGCESSFRLLKCWPFPFLLFRPRFPDRLQTHWPVLG